MSEEKKKIYLGLDVSTKTIGICLMEDDDTQYGKILELTHINPTTPKDINNIEKLFLKKKIFEEFIQKYKNLGIETVVIEEPLLQSNNVNTVSTLLRFNGMISDCVYNTLGIVPEYISSYEARQYSFPELMSIRKYGKNEQQYPTEKIIKEIKDSKLVLFGGYPWNIDKKIVIQGKVAELFPNIEWIYDKKGELKKENFDATDAYVAVYGFLNKLKKGKLEFKILNIDKQDKTINYDVTYWDTIDHRTTYV